MHSKEMEYSSSICEGWTAHLLEADKVCDYHHIRAKDVAAKDRTILLHPAVRTGMWQRPSRVEAIRAR